MNESRVRTTALGRHRHHHPFQELHTVVGLEHALVDETEVAFDSVRADRLVLRLGGGDVHRRHGIDIVPRRQCMEKAMAGRWRLAGPTATVGPFTNIASAACGGGP